MVCLRVQPLLEECRQAIFRHISQLAQHLLKRLVYNGNIHSMVDLSNLAGFDWDQGNRDKNWINHQVSTGECEEVFFNLPLLLQPDPAHSTTEARYFVLGQTNAGRHLFIAFTIRSDKIRVISARDMSKKERIAYGETNP